MSKKKRLYDEKMAMEMGSFNDDAAERRNSRLMNVALSRTSMAVTNDSINESDMRAHLKTCLKLYMDNKINAKNVWHLNVISYLRKLINEEDIFPLACSMLEVAAKIYAIKVDDLYAQAVKFSQDLRRLMSKGGYSNAADDEAAEDIEGQDKSNENQPKRKKKTRILSATNKPTISKNPGKLFGDIQRLPSKAYGHKENPFSSSNLLIHKLLTDSTNLEYKILSQEKYFKTADHEDQSLNDVKYKITIPQMSGFICKIFSDFHLDIWNADDTIAVNPPNLEEVLYDDQGIPMHELDGSLHDNFQDDVEHDPEEMRFEEARTIPSFQPEDAITTSDYNYCSSTRNGEMVRVWAGPSYWKFKYIKPATSRFTGTSDTTKEKHVKEKTRKKPNENPDIDFFNMSEINKADFNSAFKRRRQIQSTDLYKFTLPQRKVTDCKALFFATCKKIPIIYGTDTVIDDNNEIEPYNYDNLNDSQYCTRNNDDIEDEDLPNEVNTEQALDNFVMDAVTVEEDICIRYEKKAKHINMKKVKGKILELIKDESTGEIKETTFANLNKELPKVLDAMTASKLSVPLEFLSCLYLANENNLSLTQEKGNLGDFKISKG